MNNEDLESLVQHLATLDARLDGQSLDLIQTKRTIARLAVLFNQMMRATNAQIEELTTKLEELTATRH